MRPTRALVLAAARAYGWPRVEVRVPGLMWPLEVEPTQAAWERVVGLFARDPGVLQSALDALSEWERNLEIDTPAGLDPGETPAPSAPARGARLRR